ncbi:helix-turn-helix domain-containing protein [Hyphobacterium sp. SN044]|uniref:helix-turn-helix domain-containing protein n=1 Tax=Hyphobacterium sp. SN044 TaxID=2912575 RepID=UPI001F421E24|nr:helix-turn-helix transcriptional regulator [Hyphobacterium sp. SN044]MCF8878405.1 helix-turn-helix domain-containing protein [Hyphobacterium sp. SN044]
MAFKTDAKKIKRWREERHWSQEHLAELAGVGIRTVQRIETGEPASKDTLMALAAAFNVDAMALCIDPEEEATARVRTKNEKMRSGILLSFLIHLVSYVLGMIIFTAISVGMGAFVMKWAMIWWTVGLTGHAVPVVLIFLVTRFQEQE